MSRYLREPPHARRRVANKMMRILDGTRSASTSGFNTSDEEDYTNQPPLNPIIPNLLPLMPISATATDSEGNIVRNLLEEVIDEVAAAKKARRQLRRAVKSAPEIIILQDRKEVKSVEYHSQPTSERQLLSLIFLAILATIFCSSCIWPIVNDPGTTFHSYQGISRAFRSIPFFTLKNPLISLLSYIFNLFYP